MERSFARGFDKNLKQIASVLNTSEVASGSFSSMTSNNVSRMRLKWGNISSLVITSHPEDIIPNI